MILKCVSKMEDGKQLDYFGIKLLMKIKRMRIYGIKYYNLNKDINKITKKNLTMIHKKNNR